MVILFWEIKLWKIVKSFSNLFVYSQIQFIYEFLHSQGKNFHYFQLWCPPEGWKIVLLPWNFHHKTISMLITCVTNFKAKRFTQKDIQNLPTCVIVKDNFTTANFDTLPKIEKKHFGHEIFGMRPSLCW